MKIIYTENPRFQEDPYISLIEEDMKREEVMESLQDPHSELTITMSSVFPNESKYLTHID